MFPLTVTLICALGVGGVSLAGDRRGPAAHICGLAAGINPGRQSRTFGRRSRCGSAH